MKIEFDQAADAAYIELAEGDIDRTEEIKPGLILDYDVKGNVLGVEILYIRKRASQSLSHAA
jgi:uncharacterized protein YuzE